MMVWAAAAALGLGLAALEARRADRRHLGVRMVAVLVAVASLAALVRPPSLPSLAPRTDVVLLVTPGANETAVARLRDSLPGVPMYRWPDSIADLADLRLHLPDLHRLHVAGWGLREAFWIGHDDMDVSFHPAPPPYGISHVAWPAVVRLGDAIPFVARLNAPTDEGAIWLERPNGTVDSLPLSGLAGPVARFQATANAAGEWAYVLGMPGIPAETLHVAVRPAKPPAVLILEGSPAFETTFLRRWLAEQGATVAVRSRLSRDQFRTERINLPGVALGTITETLLNRFDIVMLDGSTLQALSGAERGALDRAIREGGLGLLVAPDSLARRDAQRFPFRLTSTGDLDIRMVRPQWRGQRGGTSVPVPAMAEEIVAAAGVRPLMRDPAGRVVAATAAYGAGMVGTSMILAPSRWLLEEEPAAFAGYWQAMIAALARNRSDQWALAADGPPAVDLALSLVLVTSDSQPRATVTRPDGLVDSLGLARDPAEPQRWWGRYWPMEAGWHHATNGDGEPYPFHVSVLRDTAREAAARLMATARRAGASPVDSEGFQEPARRPLPPLLPFLALVVATGVLWGEGRLGVRSKKQEVSSEQ
ncbi:MAG: hypothetical protein ABR551_06915 [Gemmatimonadales bacterium]